MPCISAHWAYAITESIISHKQLFAVKPAAQDGVHLDENRQQGTRAGYRMRLNVATQDQHTSLMKHSNAHQTVFETVKHQEGFKAIN